jgi:hypothetical protein
MNWTEICKLVLNPNTNMPITRGTLNKSFRQELNVGSAALKALVASKYYEALERGEPWSLRLALRNKFNFVLEGSQPVAPEVLGIPIKDEHIAISFIMPTPKPQDQPQPIDVTPSGPIDHTQPRLPPPPERQHTPFGAIW